MNSLRRGAGDFMTAYGQIELPLLFGMYDNITNITFLDVYYDWRKEWEVLHDQRWKAAVIALYVIVIVFGCMANVLVVVVIIRYRQLHTVTNVFIVALGLADVALCVFNLPLQLHYQLTDNWAFGRPLCHIAMTTFAVPMFASSLFILMIAIDRYMLIVYPFKRRMTVRSAILIASAIVVFTVALSVPMMVYTRAVIIDHFIDTHKVYCVEAWPSLPQKQTYSVIVILLQFVLPLVFTSVFYRRLCTVLRNRPLKRNETRRNLRTNRILITVVLTFTLCWLPWNLFSLTSEFNQLLVKGKYFRLVDLLLKIFAMGSACVNPFLYGWLNDNFKKELGKFFGYTLCWKRPGRTQGESISMGYFSKTTNVANQSCYQPPGPASGVCPATDQQSSAKL